MVPLDHGRLAREIFSQFLRMPEEPRFPEDFLASRPAGNVASKSPTTTWILHGVAEEERIKRAVRFAALLCLGVSLYDWVPWLITCGRGFRHT